MNGVVTALDERGFTARVGQSFGNCPQYIQARQPHFVAPPESISAPHTSQVESAVLSAGAAEIVRRSDTFFIATASPNARDGDATDGVDVSHRGGKPGFVRLTEQDNQTVLTVPDFRGNNHFNTFGNIALNPRAGVLFIDFDSGDLLSLTGEAEVIWHGPEIEAFAGAQRLLRMRVQRGVWIKQAVPLRWSAPEQARQLDETGSWEDAARLAPLD
jgi:predicted pyridoxine 5'-phosphate oxidase superfamily flavin-nucleotide-binding protein